MTTDELIEELRRIGGGDATEGLRRLLSPERVEAEEIGYHFETDSAAGEIVLRDAAGVEIKRYRRCRSR